MPSTFTEELILAMIRDIDAARMRIVALERENASLRQQQQQQQQQSPETEAGGEDVSSA